MIALLETLMKIAYSEVFLTFYLLSKIWTFLIANVQSKVKILVISVLFIGAFIYLLY